MGIGRRSFIGCAGAGIVAQGLPLSAAAGDAPAASMVTDAENALIDRWQKETDLVTPDIYAGYLSDGDTRGFATLEKLEAAFAKVMREVKETVVPDGKPAVWSVYNMGYVVKTREAVFSIDLVHRRAAEFAPLLDFALVTHNHGDHFHRGLYAAMNGAGKTVISNFLDNYGAPNWRKNGGYVRGVKEFSLKDVRIRTSLIDHNDYLVDFTTAFEIKTGDFRLYHTGDSGKGTEPKLVNAWGAPDLWLFFPGCGIDPAKAAEKTKAKRIVFGHLWELAHLKGRLNAPLIRKALAKTRAKSPDVSFGLWGDRIC